MFPFVLFRMFIFRGSLCLSLLALFVVYVCLFIRGCVGLMIRLLVCLLFACAGLFVLCVICWLVHLFT